MRNACSRGAQLWTMTTAANCNSCAMKTLLTHWLMRLAKMKMLLLSL